MKKISKFQTHLPQVSVIIISSVLLTLFLCLTNCTHKGGLTTTEGAKMGFINSQTIDGTIKALIDKYGEQNRFRIEKGVKQTANLWQERDGSQNEFQDFCLKNFIAKEDELDKLFNRLQTNFESIRGNLTKLNLELNRPLALDMGETMPIDQEFGAYDPFAHLTDDFFDNKIAFNILLNFPFYSLDEKSKLGPNWTRKQWAYARMGDMYNSRVPASVSQGISKAQSEADLYISEYNIFMGNLVDNNNKTLFPKDLKLITHWGLRDELKSQYANPTGLENQKMIYEVMKRIITQEIPQQVINKNEYQWNPYTNKIIKDGKEVTFSPEPNTRYQHFLNNFKAVQAVDVYSPNYPNYIKRTFEQDYEIPQEKVEQMFIKFISSPVVKEVAQLISKRLKRKLEPFDIWYDGFKSRGSIPQEQLDKATMAKYPNVETVQKDLPNILVKMGFTKEKADFIASKVQVDPSRGAGHAAGAEMRTDKSHLRTRVGINGMDYKGYNIAVHEFGHNTEQTINMQDVDYYMLSGVPNTAFTEAWAFVFQKRDLEILGIKENNPDKDYLLTLDDFWMAYEIMGVSLVDMDVWKWLYQNPDATPEQLKKQVILIAKDIWNKYYADVFGIDNQLILAIYSHMIDYPLYLSAYPIGHLVQFQMEQYMQGKNIGTEMQRMLVQGRLLPDIWMQGAVGKPLSIEPMITAAEEALKHIYQVRN
jgi:hypothetical protein